MGDVLEHPSGRGSDDDGGGPTDLLTLLRRDLADNTAKRELILAEIARLLALIEGAMSGKHFPRDLTIRWYCPRCCRETPAFSPMPHGFLRCYLRRLAIAITKVTR